MIAKVSPLIRLPSTADVFDYFVPPDLEKIIRPGQLVSIPWRSTEERGVVLDLVSSPTPPTPPRAGGDLSNPLLSALTSPPFQGGVGVVLRVGVRFRARPIRKIIDQEPILNFAQLGLIKKFSTYYFCPPGAVARLIVPEKVARVVKSTSPLSGESAINFKIEKSQLPVLNQAAGQFTRQTRHLEIKDISSFIWLVFWLSKQKEYSSLTILAPTIHWLETIGLVLKKKFGESLAVIHSSLSRGHNWRAYQKILQGRAKIILSTRQGVFLPLPPGGCIVLFDAGSDDFKQYDQHPRYDSRTVVEWVADETASQIIYAAPTFALWPLATPISLPPASGFKSQARLIDMKQSLGQKGFSIISEAALEAVASAARNKKKAVIISLREQSEQGISVKKIQDVLTEEMKNVSVIANEFDVLVATPQILESGELAPLRGKISSLIIASIEPLLALPDYRSQERAFYRLKHWQMLCQELLIPQILLQSYNTDILAVRAFALGEEKEFKKSELDFRQELGYPPFVELVKVSYKGGEQSEWNRVSQELKSLGPKLQILGPYAEHRSKRKSLLLKLRDKIEIPLLYSLPSSQWVVDRDPENVL